MIFNIFIFICSCVLLFLSGKFLVKPLLGIARYLGWREFIVAFFLMSIASSIPNLFVGITAAVQGIPQLSFGDIMGGNLIDLTIAVALAVLFARGIQADSKMVQGSAIFTLFAAILPLALIVDGKLNRFDGILLLLLFFIYSFWIFSKRERFTKIYDGKGHSIVAGFKSFIKDIGKSAVGIVLLIVAAQGIVHAASFFSNTLNLPLVLIGILIVGIGNAIPETYFAIVAARKENNWMILGDLMGSVIVCATMVLGIVAIICPIEITNFSPFLYARLFLVLAAAFFLIFVRTDRKISVKEALFLLSIYIGFLITEILTK